MKYLISIVILAVLVQNLFGQTNKDSLDALVTKLGQDLIKEKQLVGLSVGIYNNGKSSFYNFGTTESGKQIKPTENTVFEIGSITKTIISLLLANAVVDKKVKLDDDIRKYLEGKYPNLEYEGNPIRIIHLANTSSGLPDFLPPIPDDIQKASTDSASALRNKFFGSLTKKDFYAALREVKLNNMPGTYGKHSNAAALLLGYILENVYKKTIEQLLKENITKALKMNETSFLVSNAKSRNLAKGYDSKGKLMPYESAFINSSGGLKSSTSDLLKYAKFLLDNKTEITKTVLERNIEIDMQSGKVASINSLSPYNPSAYSVSLNWFSYKFDNGITQIWADGGTSGFVSYLVILPKLNSGIVLLANVNDEKTFKTLPGMSYQIIDILGKK